MSRTNFLKLPPYVVSVLCGCIFTTSGLCPVIKSLSLNQEKRKGLFALSNVFKYNVSNVNKKTIFGISFVSATFAVIISLGFFSDYLNKTNRFAAAFFSMGISVKELITRYSEAPSNGKIKILIVPGHESDFGGAEYKNLLERDLNLALALKLKTSLASNQKFEVIMERDSNGLNKDIENYILKNEDSILKWVGEKKQDMLSLVGEGKVSLVNVPVYHANAPSRAVVLLYGINKWAGENKIDIILHIHFNDNPKYKGKPNYEGFSIYVPESQYSNSTSSQVLAKDLFSEISKIKNVSTMPQENGGVIEDQDLIAVGSYNTSDSLSVLVEYAYIYESFMQKESLRNFFINNAASSTANALFNFFNSRVSNIYF